MGLRSPNVLLLGADMCAMTYPFLVTAAQSLGQFIRLHELDYWLSLKQ